MRNRAIKESIITWVAWHLPRSVAYWAAIRVMTNATVGEWAKQAAPELTCVDALRRWEKNDMKEFYTGVRIVVKPLKPNGERHPHAGKTGVITETWMSGNNMMVKVDPQV